MRIDGLVISEYPLRLGKTGERRAKPSIQNLLICHYATDFVVPQKHTIRNAITWEEIAINVSYFTKSVKGNLRFPVPPISKGVLIGRTTLTLLKSYLAGRFSAVEFGYQTLTRAGLVTVLGTDDPYCCEGLTTAP